MNTVVFYVDSSTSSKNKSKLAENELPNQEWITVANEAGVNVLNLLDLDKSDTVVADHALTYEKIPEKFGGKLFGILADIPEEDDEFFDNLRRETNENLHQRLKDFFDE